MRGWPILLGGLAIWAAHFFVLYALGDFAPDTLSIRFGITGLTVLCLGGELMMLRACLVQTGDGFEQWQRQVGAIGAAVAMVAILWQGLVPLF